MSGGLESFLEMTSMSLSMLFMKRKRRSLLTWNYGCKSGFPGIVPIETFIPVYRRAKKEGLRLKAHVGEWGSAQDIQKAVELLELDEVQHGIAAAYDKGIMRFLTDNHIRLNITPTSNILLGRVEKLKEHPISLLYRNGVDVTINSDDV